MNHYEKSRICISDSEQVKIKKFKIPDAGCLTVIEGGKLELTNLDRQNYIYIDIDKTKAKGIVQWI